MKSGEFFGKFLSKYLWGNLLAMLLVLLLLCVGVKYGLDLYTHHGEGIKVPDLTRMTFESARSLIEGDGLAIVVTDSGYNKKLPADCILAQTPGAGTMVKTGHVIYVTVNSPSSPSFAIPDVIDNSSLREAEAKLTAMGFRLLEPKRVHGEKDWVYGILCKGRPVATGDHVSIDAPLMLVIGDGMYDAGEIDYTDEYSSGGEVDDFEEISLPETEATVPPKGKNHDKIDDSGLSDF